MIRTKFVFEDSGEFLRVLNAVKDSFFLFIVMENEITIFGEPAARILKNALEENNIMFRIA